MTLGKLNRAISIKDSDTPHAEPRHSPMRLPPGNPRREHPQRSFRFINPVPVPDPYTRMR